MVSMIVMRTFIPTTIGIVLALGLLCAGLYYGAGQYVQPLTNNEAQTSAEPEAVLMNVRAPYFDLPDLSGEHRTLTTLNDRPLVLAFFATWNAAAADQIKVLDDYLLSQPEKRELVHIVVIDTQEERSAVFSFIRRGGYTVEILIDQNGATGEAYRIKGLPTSYFIDTDGGGARRVFRSFKRG